MVQELMDQLVQRVLLVVQVEVVDQIIVILLILVQVEQVILLLKVLLKETQVVMDFHFKVTHSEVAVAGQSSTICDEDFAGLVGWQAGCVAGHAAPRQPPPHRNRRRADAAAVPR